jgi:transposase
MEQQISQLMRNTYGRKSETVSPDQLRLFGEIESVELPEEPLPEQKPVIQKGHGRRKPSRLLPRVRREHKLSDEQLACPECSSLREKFGEEITEQYDYVPASVQVIEHVQFKYACKRCAGHVIVAPKPPSLLERCLATEAMVAEIATRKLGDHLPLNRLEGILKRDGAKISRSTMCDWLMALADGLQPLYARMVERVLQSEVIWTDDTPVKMQDREHEKNIRTARAWAYIGDSANPYTVFDFT